MTYEEYATAQGAHIRLLWFVSLAFGLLGLATVVIPQMRDVKLLRFCLGGAIGGVMLSATLWFYNYPLQDIDVRARVSSLEARAEPQMPQSNEGGSR